VEVQRKTHLAVAAKVGLVEAAGGKILLKTVVTSPYTEDTYEYKYFDH